MAGKRAFWVVSKQTNEIGTFGKMKIPAQFKTFEEARKYMRELNLRKGAYHPGYFVEERIGGITVAAIKKAEEAAAAEEPE
jgi:hypothetical protein